ncbi:MAG: M48 family metalloprotease [Ilumatobacteraceae bacterium]
MTDGRASYGRRETTAMAVIVVVAGLIGSVIGVAVDAAIIGMVLGVAVAGVAVRALRRRAVRLVLAVSGARPVPLDELPRLRSLIEGLGLANGLPRIDLYLIDESVPNAMVADGPSESAAVVVTSGLVERLDRIELEGVVGHLLSRIKTGEARTSTSMAVLVGGVPLLGALAIRTQGRWAGPGRLAAASFPVFAPLLRRSLPPASSTTADLAACRMTRYPPGLIAALEKIRDAEGVTHAATAVTAHLWFEQPLNGMGDDSRTGDPHRRFVTHPTLDERVALLREL